MLHDSFYLLEIIRLSRTLHSITFLFDLISNSKYPLITALNLIYIGENSQRFKNLLKSLRMGIRLQFIICNIRYNKRFLFIFNQLVVLRLLENEFLKNIY